jgi:glucosamine-6-phosphate deaminase
MTARTDEGWSAVEQAARAASPHRGVAPENERIGVVVVENFPALGRLAALRFLEWAQNHPGGVAALPTGKTPEHFIRWVRRFLTRWDDPEVGEELEHGGIDPATRPDLASLHFVQIDEFYPMNPGQHNSFHYYVNEYYLRGFGLDPDKALLIDCSAIGRQGADTMETVWPDKRVDLSLRHRQPASELEERQKAFLERIDQWCQDYEERIRELGGIGFFLGGIGPDGHIGFNVRGSDHHSTTRLTATNYETQAASAADLGGIEISRQRLVITIGLGTIAFNPNCTAVIIAAGEAKAQVVADAVQQEPSVRYPATALHSLPQARFYLTQGAAKLLGERRIALLAREEAVSDREAERVLIDLAVARNTRLLDLTDEDCRSDPAAALVLEKRPENRAELAQAVHDRLIARIEAGAAPPTGTRFFHTEPHHDDLMLGYLPQIVRAVRDPSNAHWFVCMTGGFTAVTNHFVLEQLEHLEPWLNSRDFAELMAQGYFEPHNPMGRQRDVWQYLDGVAADSEALKSEGIARRLLRDLMDVFDEFDLGNLANRIAELEHYFRTQYPGKKDPEHIQDLKAKCREWEAECLWGYFGWNCANVVHLSLGFYTGDIFNPEPSERDVAEILTRLRDLRPDIVSAALDPEASGPDTHYKVLQAVTQAVRRYADNAGRDDLRVWGYRNVWYRFHPAEANVYVPVSLNMFSILRSAFMNTFNSQRSASFPSHQYDGPFCDLAQRIQTEQYQMVKTCLGRRWFHEHPSALIRATRGLVFLEELSLPEFVQRSRELKRATEDVSAARDGG